MLGLGAALKILLLPEDMISTSVSRDELVALINAFAKMSTAMKSVKSLKAAYFAEEAKRLSSDNTAASRTNARQPHATTVPVYTLNDAGYLIDRILFAVRRLRVEGAMNARDEDAIVDLGMARHSSLLVLSKHYLGDSAEDRRVWLRHVLRSLDAMAGDLTQKRPYHR